MGLACPLCTTSEAFKSLQILYVALSSINVCPVCQSECPSSESLAQHIFLCHLQDDTPTVCNSSESSQYPLDELLEDFSEFVRQEEQNVKVKEEEEDVKKIETEVKEGSSKEDPNYEAFQKALSENHNDIPSSSNKPVQCNICGWNFDNNNFLQIHVVLMHSSRLSSPANPEIPEASQKVFNCRFCSEGSCGSFDEYVRHVRSAHNDYRYICHICLRMFKLRGSLLVHHRVVHTAARAAQNRLDEDGRQNKTSEPEEGHAPPKLDLMDSKAPQIQCQHCQKVFKRESHLNQHLKVHENKFWDCDVCHKSFTTKYFLKKHKRLHTGETPYACGICGKCFTFQQSYHKHMLYHTDEKPHNCTQCGRAFKELSTLQNHERIHSGERPFGCETCGKSFRQRVSYLVHRRIHTGAMPYSCKACGKNFRYKVTQRTHKCPAITVATEEPSKNGIPELPLSIQNDLQKFRQQVQGRRLIQKYLQRNELADQQPTIGGKLKKLSLSSEEDSESLPRLPEGKGETNGTRADPNPQPLNFCQFFTETF